MPLSPGMAMLFMGSQVSRGVRRAAERRLAADERRQMRLIRRQEMREERAFRARETERGRKFGGQMEEARRSWQMAQEAGRMEARRAEAETAFGRQQELGETGFGRQRLLAKEQFEREAPRRWGQYDIAEAREAQIRAQTAKLGQPTQVGQMGQVDLSEMAQRFDIPEGVLSQLPPQELAGLQMEYGRLQATIQNIRQKAQEFEYYRRMTGGGGGLPEAGGIGDSIIGR